MNQTNYLELDFTDNANPLPVSNRREFLKRSVAVSAVFAYLAVRGA